MNGLGICARYSYPPNKLGFCGPRLAHEQLLDFISSHKNSETAKKLICSFEAQLPYLSLIADCNSIEPFDYEVAEALWVGNNLLEQVPVQKLRDMVEREFSKPGLLPKNLALKIVEKIPDGCVPHHSFHSLFLPSITGRVDFSLIENKDACRVSWGNVISVSEESATILRKPLITNQNKFELGVETESKIKIIEKFTHNLDTGDAISIHWGHGIQKLSRKELSNLERYTMQNIEAITPIL